MSGTVATVEPATPSAVIDRISLVLDAFDGPGRLTLAQIVRRTGLPRSSAHRMLERLVQLRWLRRSGRDYELGMRLVELGSLAVHQDRLVRAAGPLLGELHRATGLVVHLAVLDGPDVVYLEKIGDRYRSPPGSAVVSPRTAPPSARRSWRTATRTLQDAQVDLRVRKTKYSISTSSQLAVELAKVRAHGVAFEREESLLGFGCVAAPIGEPGRGGRRGVGVWSDESHDVRSAAGRPGTHDRDGHLAQRRRRPAAGCADPAAVAAVAAPASCPGPCSTREPRSADRPADRGAGRRLPAGPHHDRRAGRATIRSRFVPPPSPSPSPRSATTPSRARAATSRSGSTGPTRDDQRLPILVYGHGGGFVFCDLDSHDGLCRNIANRVPAVVISVAYRLAPEHRWPAAADDFYAATRWAAHNARASAATRAASSSAATARAATWPP